MAVIKCKMCGGDLALMPDSSVAECEYCGSRQTVPNQDNEKKLTLFGRANRLRFHCEFDKASGIYESIVAEFPEEAEAYWGLVLCKYGIEYVDDPGTGKKIPTCHRSSFDSILEDADFEQALENADPVARKVYRDEAKQIEQIRKGIIDVSSKEEPYDIFICYKETDPNGNRTLDSVLAQDIYDALTEKGYRVFFARITLEDKLGQEYEPYIFAALSSAKIMLAVGTDYEYFNAVWVKNEWSRFLKLISKGEKKYLIPCFKNIDPQDMPKEFARLQSQNLGQIGAIQDLLRGIGKLLPLTPPAAPAPKPAVPYTQPRREPRQNVPRDKKHKCRFCDGYLPVEIGASAVMCTYCGSVNSLTGDPMDEIRLLIQNGRKLEAIKSIRSHYGVDLKDAKTVADEVEATGQSATLAKHSAAQEEFEVPKAAPQGVSQITACVRNKDTAKGTELIQKYYNLLPDQAAAVYHQMEQCLLNDRYPRKPDNLSGDEAGRAWNEAVKCFNEIKTQIRELDEAEKGTVQASQKCASSNNAEDRTYYAKRAEYYRGRITYYVGRIQYYMDRLKKAETILDKYQSGNTAPHISQPVSQPAVSNPVAPAGQSVAAIQSRLRPVQSMVEVVYDSLLMLQQGGRLLQHTLDGYGNGTLQQVLPGCRAVCVERCSPQTKVEFSVHDVVRADSPYRSHTERQWGNFSLDYFLTWDGRVVLLNHDTWEPGVKSIPARVSTWKNIRKICVTLNLLFGLRENGELEVCRLMKKTVAYADSVENTMQRIQSECGTGVADICTTMYHVIILRTDGTVKCYGLTGKIVQESAKWKDIAAISYTDNHLVTLRSDGTVQSCRFDEINLRQGHNTAAWRNVIAVKATKDAVYAVTENGQVLRTMDVCRKDDSGEWVYKYPGYTDQYVIPGLQLFSKLDEYLEPYIQSWSYLKQQWSRVSDPKLALNQWVQKRTAFRTLTRQLQLDIQELKNTTGMFAGGKRKKLEQSIAENRAKLQKLTENYPSYAYIR